MNPASFVRQLLQGRRAALPAEPQRRWLMVVLGVVLLGAIVWIGRSIGAPAPSLANATASAATPAAVTPVAGSTGLGWTTGSEGQADESYAGAFGGEQTGLTLAGSIGALILVLAAVYVSLWALRRFSGHRLAGHAASGLEVTASVRLGANQTLHVVRFGSSFLLVGASPAGLTLLSKAASDPARGSAAESEPQAESALQLIESRTAASFGEALRQAEEVDRGA